jgi:hypothetical protein
MMGNIPSQNSKDKVKGYLVVRRDSHLLMMQLNIKKQINVCLYVYQYFTQSTWPW